MDSKTIYSDEFTSESPNPVLRVGNTGKVLYINESALKVFRGNGIIKNQHISAQWISYVNNCIDNKTKTIEEVIIGKNVFQFTFIPFKDTHYVNIYGQDITEIKEVEKEIRRQQKGITNALEIVANRENRLNSFIKSINSALLAIDNDGNIMLMNKMFEDFLEIKQHDCIGKNLKSIIKNKKEFSQIIDVLENNHNEDTIKRKIAISINNEIYHFELSVSNIIEQDKDILGRIIMLTDQSEQERAKHLKHNFLNNVSHEIRTPTTSIVALIEILKTTELSDEQKDYISLIEESESTLIDLLDGFTDYYYLEKNELNLVYNNFSISRMCNILIKQLYHSLSNKNSQFEYHDSHDSSVEIFADEKRLKQVLRNILSNAIKFTNSGKIQFYVSTKETTSNTVKIQFKIIDTGIGIPENRFTEIFSPFTQLDDDSNRRYGGVGQGLYIAKTLIELMDGKIWVESELGKGSAFICEIDCLKMKS